MAFVAKSPVRLAPLSISCATRKFWRVHLQLRSAVQHKHARLNSQKRKRVGNPSDSFQISWLEVLSLSAWTFNSVFLRKRFFIDLKCVGAGACHCRLVRKHVACYTRKSQRSTGSHRPSNGDLKLSKVCSRKLKLSQTITQVSNCRVECQRSFEKNQQNKVLHPRDYRHKSWKKTDSFARLQRSNEHLGGNATVGPKAGVVLIVTQEKMPENEGRSPFPENNFPIQSHKSSTPESSEHYQPKKLLLLKLVKLFQPASLSDCTSGFYRPKLSRVCMVSLNKLQTGRQFSKWELAFRENICTTPKLHMYGQHHNK